MFCSFGEKGNFLQKSEDQANKVLKVLSGDFLSGYKEIKFSKYTKLGAVLFLKLLTLQSKRCAIKFRKSDI